MIRPTLMLFLALVSAAGCTDSLWSTSVQEVSVTHRPGFAPPAAPPTEECPGEVTEDTLSVVRLIASSRGCVADDGGDALILQSASHGMTQDEMDTLIPLLQRLEIVEPPGCPSDGPSIVLTVTTATETTAYQDARYACNNGSQLAVDGEALDQVSRAIHELAFSDRP
jgi:hypothetical protein